MQGGRLIWEVVTAVKVRGGSSNQGEKRRGGEKRSVRLQIYFSDKIDMGCQDKERMGKSNIQPEQLQEYSISV